MSKHRTGRAAGFSALRAHKSQGNEGEQASAASAKASAPTPPPGAHPPCVHADLQEQEAARRLTARASTARASLAQSTSTSSRVHRVHRDVVMTDAPAATSARQDPANASGAAVPDAVALADAMVRDAKQDKRILLKDLLFVLEREVFAHGTWAAIAAALLRPHAPGLSLPSAHTLSHSHCTFSSQLSIGCRDSQSADAHGFHPRLGHRTLILCHDDATGLSPFYWRC